MKAHPSPSLHYLRDLFAPHWEYTWIVKMRLLLISALAAVSALAQSPAVQLRNASRPASADFQIGDRFEILITAAPSQPVSVRTTRQGRTDWGPVTGWTDSTGRWSTTGQFEKTDFGHWSEVWTVGGKLANPAVSFSVGAPCLKDGQGFLVVSGLNAALSCDTADGPQTFVTPSEPDPFRTPDGRLVPGRERSNMTAEQYHAEIMQSLITSRPNDTRSGEFGDEAGALIAKIIGVNALSEDETRKVISIIRAAFKDPDRIPEEAKDPSATLLLLRNLADSPDQPSLKQQIDETVAYVLDK
jgi:hypothetical protein